MSIYDPRDLEVAVDIVIDHLKRIEKLLERLSPPEPTPTKSRTLPTEPSSTYDNT
jgi:hypothetical protein